MEKIIDAHMHLNLKKNNPIEDLVLQVKQNNIERFMLILNSRKEKEYFFDNMEFLKKKKCAYYISVLYDLYELSYSKEFIERLAKKDILYTIKIHPRMSNLTKKDFKDLFLVLCQVECESIIIDCFSYGHHLENHIGVELGIYLAERMADKRIILAHSGGIRLLECMMLTRTLPNIYYDLSLTCNYLFDTSVNMDMVQFIRFNSNKIMFGTDYPDFNICDAVQKMNVLCNKAEISKEQHQDIFYNNAIKIYKGAYNE